MFGRYALEMNCLSDGSYFTRHVTSAGHVIGTDCMRSTTELPTSFDARRDSNPRPHSPYEITRSHSARHSTTSLARPKMDCKPGSNPLAFCTQAVARGCRQLDGQGCRIERSHELATFLVFNYTPASGRRAVLYCGLAIASEPAILRGGSPRAGSFQSGKCNLAERFVRS